MSLFQNEMMDWKQTSTKRLQNREEGYRIPNVRLTETSNTYGRDWAISICLTMAGGTTRFKHQNKTKQQNPSNVQ